MDGPSTSEANHNNPNVLDSNPTWGMEDDDPPLETRPMELSPEYGIMPDRPATGNSRGKAPCGAGMKYISAKRVRFLDSFGEMSRGHLRHGEFQVAVIN